MRTCASSTGTRMATLILMALSLGCETIAPGKAKIDVHPKFEGFHVQRVAILPFEGMPVEKEVGEHGGMVTKQVANSGEVVSDMFSKEMMTFAEFNFVEGFQIQKTLEERKLSPTDLVSDKTASEVGKSLSVDAVVLGRVDKLMSWTGPGASGSWVSFSIRMVHTLTGTVLWSATFDRKADGRTDSLKIAQQACAKIARALKRKLTPVAFSEDETSDSVIHLRRPSGRH